MPNVMNYLEWWGELSFSDVPLNEVDNLIFALLSYVDLEGVVPAEHHGKRVTLRAAAAEYFFTHPQPGHHPLGLVIPADILTLFRRMAQTRRFSDLELMGFVQDTSEERQTQFVALTLYLPEGSVFVAFRGTDDSLVGWREDLNLAIMEEVPAQRSAAEYLNALELSDEASLYVGGHSKGGNLAVWGAVHAEERVRRRIRQVYSNDGPGFSQGTVESAAYRELASRICILLPEDSLVGLLLEHDENYIVVKSNRKGLFQHDGLSWEVMGGHFLRAEGLSPTGIRNETLVRARIDAMTREERQDCIRLMFMLLESTGAKTLTDLYRGRGKFTLQLIKFYRELSEEDQEIASYLWEKLTGGGKIESKSLDQAKPEEKEEEEEEEVTSRKKEKRGRVKISFFGSH